MRNHRVTGERRKGMVIIVIVFIIAMISILSFGFATKADRELSFGQNVGVRMEMDYLSHAGLNYGKSLVMNPQNVTTGSSGYWTGGSGLQIESGSDYFDVTVSQATSGNTKKCTYNITSEAYRKVNGSNIATNEISGVLRLDPCIGYVQVNDITLPAAVRVNGDVWCGKELRVYGIVYGDVFAAGTITRYGTIEGTRTTGVASCPVSVPSLSVADYSTRYYIGSQMYFVQELNLSAYNDLNLAPSAANPAGIFYRNGTLDLNGVTNITGTLVVKSDLRIYDKKINITSVKNFPALLVGDDIGVGASGASLNVTGLTQVYHNIDVASRSNVSLVFTGALHVLTGAIKNTGGSGTSVTVTADPMKASLKTCSGAGSVAYWMPAGGSFFKQIYNKNTGPSVDTSKDTYSVGESIVVSFSNAAGYAYDWIGLYEAGAADNEYTAWMYLGGNINGSVTFGSGLSPAGNYEARMFFYGSWINKAVTSFTVK